MFTSKGSEMRYDIGLVIHKLKLPEEESEKMYHEICKQHGVD
jgi:hypothetical protein